MIRSVEGGSQPQRARHTPLPTVPSLLSLSLNIPHYSFLSRHGCLTTLPPCGAAPPILPLNPPPKSAAKSIRAGGVKMAELCYGVGCQGADGTGGA